MSSVMRQFLDNSYLFGGNAPFIEDLYEKYLANPQSVPEEWREYFDRMQVLPGSTVKDVARAPEPKQVAGSSDHRRQPECSTTMPPLIDRCDTRAKPAARIISANAFGRGKRRIDSTR